MLRVLLIRHGQSESNAGRSSAEPHVISLTALGRRQAHQVAQSLTTPALIVSSPYLRARQTAQPAIDRFAGVRRAEWPVQEFTYLGDLHGRATTGEEREPYVRAYWDRMDPHYANGGAESFASLVARVQDCLNRLAEQRAGPIVVFTHGLFMKAVVWSLRTGTTTVDSAAMRDYREFANTYPVANCSTVELELTASGWRVRTSPDPDPGP